jgi:hypothetical protein
VIVSTVGALAHGWLPLGDRAVIGIRAFDVLTTHPPLLGQYSAASQVIGDPVLSPGPMLYWLLALPVRLGDAALPITVGIVNVCCVVGSVALAHRRGGLPLMFVTAAAIAVMCGSLDASIFHDIWNPAAAVMPFMLLIFLAWSLACGEFRLLPLTALVASFVVQAQLTYALPTLALLAVALPFLFAGRPSSSRRWLLATLAVVAVCWSFPVAEEVVHRPGNVERIAEVAMSDAPKLGGAAGWHSAVRAIGLRPWWLESPRDTFARVADVNYRPPTAAIVTAALMLAALIAVAIAAFRVARRDLAAAALLALGLLLALALVTASTPSGGILFGVVVYTLWWAAPAGMFCWLVVGFGAATLLAHRRRLDALRVRGGAGWSAAAVAGVTVISALIAGGGEADTFAPAFDPTRAMVDAARAAVPKDATVVVEGPRTIVLSELKGAIALGLRREGARFLSADPPGIGTRYDPARHPHSGSLEVTEGAPQAGGGRVIEREQIDGVPADAPPAERARRTVVLTLKP